MAPCGSNGIKVEHPCSRDSPWCEVSDPKGSQSILKLTKHIDTSHPRHQ